MRILIACEYSGVVREAFRDKEHDAWSCDLLSADDSSPYHYQEDIRPLLDLQWDLILAFPPCTHLAVSGARWFEQKRQDGRQQQGIDFFMEFTRLKCRWCIENPVGIMSTHYRKPDQIVQPWQFGHGETKATCLWLNWLPELAPTDIVAGREPRIWKMGPSKNRWKERSKTYEGIARAMADQWG